MEWPTPWTVRMSTLKPAAVSSVAAAAVMSGVTTPSSDPLAHPSVWIGGAGEGFRESAKHGARRVVTIWACKRRASKRDALLNSRTCVRHTAMMRAP